MRTVRGESKASGGAAPDPIVADELELLEGVSRCLAEAPEARAPSETPIVRELERLRELLVSGDEAKDAAALHQQWHRQSSLLRQLRVSRRAPQVDPRSPYFAHLRLREKGRERDLCLGRATRISDGIRIVDWRNAPISRVFYRYEQGEEYEEEFAGRARVGEILARRTVAIQDGVLNRVEAPEGVFAAEPGASGQWRRSARERPRLAGGEASALRAHTPDESGGRALGTELRGGRRRADKRLPEITALIDSDQFELIARPSSGFLVIRGSAGSGKTTVALHRIAFLAYDDPAFDSEQTLFVAFSTALRRYVGHVLPSLGVENVRIVSFSDWANAQRRHHFPSLPSAVREDTPAGIQTLKLHPALGTALEQQVRDVSGPATAEQALDDWASVLTRRDLLDATFRREAPGLFSGAELGRLVDWSRRRHEDLFEWMGGDSEAPAELDPEDAALLLRAWQLRVGPLQTRKRRLLRYRHVAIDEVQEFSPLEVRVLLDCLDERRSLTLAGDTQQHVSPHGGFTSWSGFLGRLGVPGAEVETLRVSYRSSQQIVAFAMSVLGDLVDDEAPLAARQGPPVELFRFGDTGACVAFLADSLRALVRDEPLASVAVLTPSTASSETLYEGLARCELPSLRRIAHQDFTFAPGVEVTEIDQARGLEFDYVILVGVGADAFPDKPDARRLLHLGATRAIHQLWLCCVGTPSPLLGVLHAGGS